jgi:hypothetical protein
MVTLSRAAAVMRPSSWQNKQESESSRDAVYGKNFIIW